MTLDKKRYLIKSVGVVLAVSILAKITAFLTEAIIAAFLGTSSKADAYSMINGIREVFYPMLSIGIWKIFLPEYKKSLITNGIKYADNLANKMLTIFLIGSILITLFMLFCSNIVVTLVAPGFEGTVRDLTIQLIRISSPQYIFIIIAAFFSSMLQAHDKFFASQIREVVTYIPLILAAIFLYNIYGVSVLAIGLLLGSVFRLLVQIPYLNWGYKFRLRLDLKDSNVIEMLKRMPSALVTACVTQLNILVDKIMASSLSIGAVASLSYGQRLINVFSGLVTSAISTALYPTMAQLVAENDSVRLKSLLVKTIYIVSLIIIPISIACILFAKDIVSIVFQRGAFDSHSVYYTAIVFSSYAIGMLFTGMEDIFSNVFYCYGDTKTTMRISLVTITLNIILNIIFVRIFGIAGIALASSIAAIIGTSSLFVLLKRHVSISLAELWLELVKITLVAIVACGFALLCVNIFDLKQVILKMIVACVTGIVFYTFGLIITRSEAIKILLLHVRR